MLPRTLLLIILVFLLLAVGGFNLPSTRSLLRVSSSSSLREESLILTGPTNRPTQSSVSTPNPLITITSTPTKTITPPISPVLLICEEDIIVQADDSLSKLAEKFYGDALAFPAIVEATNAIAVTDSSYAIIENVDIIEPSWKLCMPAPEDAMAMLGSFGEEEPTATFTHTPSATSGTPGIEIVTVIIKQEVTKIVEVEKVVVITATPIPPITPGSQDLSIIFENAFKGLTPGQILFNPSQEMTVGEKERVEVRIAKNTTITTTEELLKELKGRGEPQIENITVNSFMKVRLRSNDRDFDIKALSHEDQMVLEGGFTQWNWDVTPLRAGDYPLSLIVTVRIKILNCGEEIKDLPVLEKQIKVHVNPIYTVREFGRNYWQWIIGTIIPILSLTVTIYYAQTQNSKRQTEIENLKRQIAEGVEEKEYLEKEIARLQSIKQWQFWRK